MENYIENTDGTYEGELNDSVALIIEGLTSQVNDLDEGEFINLIRKGIKELIGYFEGNVDSINEDIIHFFAFDCLKPDYVSNQTIAGMNRVRSATVHSVLVQTMSFLKMPFLKMPFLKPSNVVSSTRLLSP